MRYFYLFLLLTIGSCIYNTSKAASIGIGSSLNSSSQEDNTAKYIRLAGGAIEKKHYSSAIDYLNIALRDLKRLNYDGYNYEYGMYTEQIKEIEKLIEYCKYKEKNPDDNPYERTKIGFFTSGASFIDVYGYGIKELEYVIFQIRGNNCIYIDKSQIQVFASILNDLNESIKVMNSSKRGKKVPTRQFPVRFTLNYWDKRSEYIKPHVFEADIRNADGTYFACIYDLQEEHPVLFFAPEENNESSSLSILVEVMKDANYRYLSRTKEKVHDNDFFLSKIHH